MNDMSVLERLGRSRFRSSFRLGAVETQYYVQKGPETIRRHAEDFVFTRLAAAWPDRDGKQTPMRGHPVFIAQHATATCCRSCLLQWHQLPMARELTVREQAYVVDVIMAWLGSQVRCREV